MKIIPDHMEKPLQTHNAGSQGSKQINANTFKAMLRNACLAASTLFLCSNAHRDIASQSKFLDSLQISTIAGQRLTARDVTYVSRPALYDQLFAVSFADDSRSMEYEVRAREQSDKYGYGAGYFVNGYTGSDHWYQAALVYNWPGHQNGKSYYFPGFNMLFDVFYFDQHGYEHKAVGIRRFDGDVMEGDKIALRLYFQNGRVFMCAYDEDTHARAQVSLESSDDVFLGTTDFTSIDGPFTGLIAERYGPTQDFSSLSPITFHPMQRVNSPVHIFEMELNSNMEGIYQTVSRLVPNIQYSYNYHVKRGNQEYTLSYEPGGSFTISSSNFVSMNSDDSNAQH